VNDVLLAILLGIVEGITEFLPVSSTAHLRIAEVLMGISLGNGYWKMFSIVIQLGAVLCLPIYFRRRIAAMLASFPRGRSGDRNVFTHPLTLVLLAFALTSVIALATLKVIGKHLESLAVMGWSLVIGGIVMWVVDATRGVSAEEVGTGSTRSVRTTDVERTTPLQAVWIGLCQSLSAIFPGTSRSMATIAAGELAGMSRPAALEFSFLLSLPTMVAATLFDLLRVVRGHGGEAGLGPSQIDAHGWLLLAVGFVVSFLVAWAVVAWFMRWVRQRGFAPFAIWRLLVGGAVLLWLRPGG
jgi:undecaprenyl-diphosphatase